LVTKQLFLAICFDQIVFIGENFYESKINSKKVSKYKTFNDFKNSFNFSKLENTTLLIKGSRGMALERFLEFI